MLLSTEFLLALWMICLVASSVPVGVREESRCCHLSDGLYGQSCSLAAVDETQGDISVRVPRSKTPQGRKTGFFFFQNDVTFCDAATDMAQAGEIRVSAARTPR